MARSVETVPERASNHSRFHIILSGGVWIDRQEPVSSSGTDKRNGHSKKSFDPEKRQQIEIRDLKGRATRLIRVIDKRETAKETFYGDVEAVQSLLNPEIDRNIYLYSEAEGGPGIVRVDNSDVEARAKSLLRRSIKAKKERKGSLKKERLECDSITHRLDQIRGMSYFAHNQLSASNWDTPRRNGVGRQTRFLEQNSQFAALEAHLEMEDGYKPADGEIAGVSNRKAIVYSAGYLLPTLGDIAAQQDKPLTLLLS